MEMRKHMAYSRKENAYNANITTRLLRVAPGCLPQAHLVSPGDTPHRDSFGLQPAFYYCLSGDTLRAPPPVLQLPPPAHLSHPLYPLWSGLLRKEGMGVDLDLLDSGPGGGNPCLCFQVVHGL